METNSASVSIKVEIAGVVAALWYGVARNGWTRDQYYPTLLGVLLPIMFLWFILERAAWNHDLRRKGISSDSPRQDVMPVYAKSWK